MTALAVGVVLLAIAAGGAILVATVLQAVEKEVGERALSVAQAVAQLDAVREHVGRPGGEAVIQPLAERLRLATGMAYIVVLDMNGIRYSHPLQERLGTRFAGGDEGPAFAQQSYISRARGVLGPSVRAFVPVFSPDEPRQVGVVVVGELTPSPWEVLRRRWALLAVYLAAGLAVGAAGAAYLARQIKREMLGLEPADLARLLQEREAVLNAIGEGIVAIDAQGRLTLANPAACRILGVDQVALGRPIKEVIPYTRLPETLATGQAEFDQQMVVGRTVVVTNRVPIRVGGRVVGAVATFRDRTEVRRLAEQLTGASRFVEALRAQNHEWLNKLHTIAGLIALGKHQQALDFIFDATERHQEFAGFLARRFADHRVAGLLMGKRTRARELGVDLAIDGKSRLESRPRHLTGTDLVLILGNLLDNAMDAVQGQPMGQRRVVCRVREVADRIQIVVADNGPGVPRALRQAIWQPGVSGKGPGRGMGLSLVRQLVEVAGGTARVYRLRGWTCFALRLPADPAQDLEEGGWARDGAAGGGEG